jgi:hypothetical protein
MKFTHEVLGFSIELPEQWSVASYLNPTAIDGYSAQTTPADLPPDGDLRTILVVEEILSEQYGLIRCHLELTLWKNQPFKLPTRAKKYPVGELPFKARVSGYGEGGEHAAGQLDLGDGLVLHLVIRTVDPSATTDLKKVMGTAQRMVKPQ